MRGDLDAADDAKISVILQRISLRMAAATQRERNGKELADLSEIFCATALAHYKANIPSK